MSISVDQSQPLAVQRKFSRDEAIKGVLAKFGTGATGVATELAYKHQPRIPSGIFALDYSLGGGWARGRVNLSWGDKSSSKTTSVLRAIGIAQKMDLKTNKFIYEMTDAEKKHAIPLSCAFIDMEGTFDQEWATELGVDVSALTLCRPETAEEAGDVMQAYLNNGFDVVALDSLAAMIPADELSGGMEDFNVGTQARLVNKMLRKIQAVLNATGKKDPMLAPTVFLINQMRKKVGLVFGTSDIKPAGVGQDFLPTIEVKFSPGQPKFYDPKEKTLPKEIEFNFQVMKNKVSPPRIHGSYSMQLVTDDDLMLRASDVNELKTVMDFAEKLGIYGKDETGRFTMYKDAFKTKGEVVASYYLDKNRYALLKRDILSRLLAK